MNEVALTQNEGGIWICRVKPDGTIKDTEKINVTLEVIEMFCNLCKAEEGKAMLYNRNGKAFEIHVRELSGEEIMDMNAENARKGKRAMINLMGVYTAFEAANPEMYRVLKAARQRGLLR